MPEDLRQKRGSDAGFGEGLPLSSIAADGLRHGAHKWEL